MSKKNIKNKKDIEVKLFMALLHLKEEKFKKYSVEECQTNIVYLFDNYEDFKNYFVSNGFDDIGDDLLETCRMKTTKKGTIIALKRLCDYAIRKHNYMKSLSEERQFDILAVPCDRAFVVSQEKAEEFKNLKLDPAVRQQMEEMAERFRVNNLTEEGPVLRKTRKLNK